MTDAKPDNASQSTSPAAPTKANKQARATLGKTPNQTPSQKQGKTTGRGLLLWLLLIAVLAAAIVAYQNWQLQQQADQFILWQNNLTQDQQTQTTNLQSLEQQLNEFKQSLTQQAQALRAQENTVDVALEQAMQQLVQQQRQTHQALPKLALAEAEYLLRLANQRLGIEKNPDNVMPLLQAADEIVRTSQQIGSFAVRKAIAKDLITLQNIQTIDRAGIYARLASLVALTDQLSYIAPAASSSTADTVSPTTSTDTQLENTVWQQLQIDTLALFAGTWQELKGLIRIQQRSDADRMLLTPEVEKLVRMRLQLLLNQSQSALLQEQPKIYSNGLQQAEQILSQHYRQSDAITKSMLATIHQLQAININTAIADISGSLSSLQALQAAQQKQGE